MKKIFISTLALALFTLTSCDTDFDQDVADIVVTNGEADFSRYVALGNSLTSGYRDNALYSSGQLESYPAMIAQQMSLAGGGAFTQPLMPNDIGGFSNLTGFPGKLTLQVVEGSLSPVASSPGGDLDNISSGGPYQNLGVPGAKSFHLGAQGYGNPAYLALGKANPYFVRFASSASTSVLLDALAQSPTFFSLWIGNNDVLSYATSGGVGVDQTGNVDPTTYGSNDITDPNVLAGVISQYVTALTANGAKGVIANIPNVTTIPFFTRVPSKPISGLSDAQVAQLNAGYAAYNTALGQVRAAGYLSEAEYNQRYIKFEAGVANGAVIIDEDLSNFTSMGIPSLRQTASGDLILLSTSSVLTQGGGTVTPLQDQHVLTLNETTKVLTATAAYNTAIKNIATANGLAFVDANAKMQELSANSGIQWDGVKYTATFVTGGAFSLDGVHLTGRGYGIVANEFIKAINKTYKSNLPFVNPNQYSGVTFP